MLKKLIGISLLAASTAALAVPGTYVQGQLGMISVDLPSSIMFPLLPDPGVQFVPTGRLSIGHLWANGPSNFGLESGVQFYRASDTTGVTVGSFWSPAQTQYKEKDTLNGYNVDLLGVYQYDFNGGFNLQAKGGLAYIHQTIDRTNWTNGQVSAVAHGTSAIVTPEVALGMGYQFTPQFGINLISSFYFASPQPLDSSLQRMASLMGGMTYNFG